MWGAVAAAVAGLVLSVGTGLFVASEFALVNLDRAELEARAGRGETRLAIPIKALRKTSTHLSSAQLGITLTTLLTGFLMEPALSALISPGLEALGIAEGFTAPIGSVLGILIATFISMIVGELVPKNFALALPRQTGKLVLGFQLVFTAIFKPVVLGLNGSANAILKLFGVTAKEELSGARTAAELSSLVRRSAQAGVLEADTASLLDKTLRFRDRNAVDVMTPRTRLEAIARTEPVDAVIELARTSGFSRFPVVDGGMDAVSGVVHVKQAVSVPKARRGMVPVSAIQSDILRVPETMRLDVLLGELRSRSYQLALVVDEYGGTSGIVTLEDLVEELVGEVDDEHDRLRAGVVRSGRGVTFPGSLRPDELRERTGVIVPEDPRYETAAGFILASLDRLAAPGDEVVIDSGVLRVERLDGKRIDRISFTPNPVPDAGVAE